jgi:hypothetical protein
MKIKITKSLMDFTRVQALKSFLERADARGEFIAIYDYDGTKSSIKSLDNTLAFAETRALNITLSMEFTSEETAMECILLFS